MSTMKRSLPLAAALAVLFLAGCSHIPLIGKKSKASSQPKESTELASDTESEFRQRWIARRVNDLASQGLTADAARAQADAEYDRKFSATHVKEPRPYSETEVASAAEPAPTVIPEAAPAAPAAPVASVAEPVPPTPAPEVRSGAEMVDLRTLLKRWNGSSVDAKSTMRALLVRWNAMPDDDKALFLAWSGLSDEDKTIFRQLVTDTGGR